MNSVETRKPRRISGACRTPLSIVIIPSLFVFTHLQTSSVDTTSLRISHALEPLILFPKRFLPGIPTLKIEGDYQVIPSPRAAIRPPQRPPSRRVAVPANSAPAPIHPTI